MEGHSLGTRYKVLYNGYGHRGGGAFAYSKGKDATEGNGRKQTLSKKTSNSNTVSPYTHTVCKIKFDPRLLYKTLGV